MLRYFILSFVAILFLLISCTPRQGGATKATSGDGSADQKCAGTIYQGTCYPGGDKDADGATDALEASKGTDPSKADTDSDGFNDLCEILKNTNPTDITSKPSDCNFSSTVQDPVDLDPVMKATCSLYQAQKKEAEWFSDNIKVGKKCETILKEDSSGKKVETLECEDIVINDSASNSEDAENYGIQDEAEKVTLEITVTWGVSYRDVLMISNGIMTIRPWFTYFASYVEDNDDDDRQFDHHLGDLPSTSKYCEENIKHLAKVKVKNATGETETDWHNPAFLPFKIKEYENTYPFSTDGIDVIGNDDDISDLGSAFNNFSYKTHLIECKVKKQTWGADDNTEFDNNCDEDEDEDDHKCKQSNGLCETRSVTFKYSYYKTKDSDDSLELNYQDVENICKVEE